MVNDKFISKFIPVILISLILILFISFIYTLISSIFSSKYRYIDMNNSSGTSYKCYYNDESKDLRCLIPVKVQQYTKD